MKGSYAPTNTPKNNITLNANIQLNPTEDDSVNYRRKISHSNVQPVTYDTINPPLSEEEVLGANETLSKDPVNMKYLSGGGGLWSMLTGSGASASALTVNVTGGKRRKTRRHRR